MASKSANYCAFDLSGGHGLLLLCEAQLGDPLYKCKVADSDAASNSVKAVCSFLGEANHERDVLQHMASGFHFIDFTLTSTVVRGPANLWMHPFYRPI